MVVHLSTLLHILPTAAKNLRGTDEASTSAKNNILILQKQKNENEP